MQYQREAAMIVDALLNSDEMQIAKSVAVSGPRKLGAAQTRTHPQPTARPTRLPYSTSQQRKTIRSAY